MYGWWTIVSSRGDYPWYTIFFSPSCTLNPCVLWVQGSQKRCSETDGSSVVHIIKYQSTRNNTQSCMLCNAGCVCWCMHVGPHLYTCSSYMLSPWLAAHSNMHLEKFRPKWLVTRCWCKITLKSVIPSLQNNKAQRLFWRLRQLECFLRHSPFCLLLSHFPLWGLNWFPPWQLATGPLIIPPSSSSSSHTPTALRIGNPPHRPHPIWGLNLEHNWNTETLSEHKEE